MPRDEAVMCHAATQALARVEEALGGVLDNLPNRPAGWLLRQIIFPFGVSMRPPSDALGAKVATAILGDGELRRHLTSDIYIPDAREDGLGVLEFALAKAVAAQPIRARLREAMRDGRLAGGGEDALGAAVSAGILTDAERQSIEDADAARDAAIQVDFFEPEIYDTLKG